MVNQRFDFLAAYRHDIDYALADGVSLVLRKLRQKISELALTPSEKMQRDFDDEEVLICILELDHIDDDLITDDESRPLADWWWHLGKIRARTYPFELLSPHLQAVYAETENNP